MGWAGVGWRGPIPAARSFFKEKARDANPRIPRSGKMGWKVFMHDSFFLWPSGFGPGLEPSGERGQNTA